MLLGKRRNFFIKKDFQSRFILRFVFIETIWAAVTALVFTYLAGKKLDDLRYSSHIDSTSASEILMPITVGAGVISLLIFVCLLAYTIHSLWQRISLPLADIKKGLNKIAGGDLSYEVALRKNDEFQDLAMDLDRMRSGLRDKIIALKEQVQVLSAGADELAASIHEGSPSMMSIASLQSAVEQMKHRMQAFHYPEERR